MMGRASFAGLSRSIDPMPVFVKKALVEHRLIAEYRKRPAYQQNDYVGWINRAKRPDTKRRRLEQMLEELRGGDRYMKMKYRPKDRRGR